MSASTTPWGKLVRAGGTEATEVIVDDDCEDPIFSQYTAPPVPIPSEIVLEGDACFVGRIKKHVLDDRSNTMKFIEQIILPPSYVSSTHFCVYKKRSKHPGQAATYFLRDFSRHGTYLVRSRQDYKCCKQGEQIISSKCLFLL